MGSRKLLVITTALTFLLSTLSPANADNPPRSKPSALINTASQKSPTLATYFCEEFHRSAIKWTLLKEKFNRKSRFRNLATRCWPVWNIRTVQWSFNGSHGYDSKKRLWRCLSTQDVGCLEPMNGWFPNQMSAICFRKFPNAGMCTRQTVSKLPNQLKWSRRN